VRLKIKHKGVGLPLESQEFHNILIIKPSSLGDVVRAVPVFEGLRSHYPQARISWLVRPDCGKILENLAGLDEIIEFDRKRFTRIGRSFKVTGEFVRFLNSLRQNKFDLVLDLQGLFRSGFISWITCAGVRMGFSNAREWAPVFYTHKVPVVSGEHIVESLWRFAEVLGFSSEKKTFRLAIASEARRSSQAIATKAGLSAGRNYVGLLIGGTEAAKRWPSERFSQLADWILERYDLPSVLLGAGQMELDLAQRIVGRSNGQMINLVGQTDLQQLLSLLDSARLIVGNDSGPLHLAAALDVPLVSLYGPTNPAVVGPYGHLDGVVEAGKGVLRQGRYSKNPLHRIENISMETVADMIIRRLSH
jgi:heptosyltransferase-1